MMVIFRLDLTDREEFSEIGLMFEGMLVRNIHIFVLEGSMVGGGPHSSPIYPFW